MQRNHRRADRALNYLLALVLGILGAVALVHWLTPCEGATLCAGVIPLRPTVAQRMVRTWRRCCALARALDLRYRIVWAEQDLQVLRAEMELAPQQAALLERHLEVLRVRLASEQLDARGE